MVHRYLNETNTRANEPRGAVRPAPGWAMMLDGVAVRVYMLHTYIVRYLASYCNIQLPLDCCFFSSGEKKMMMSIMMWQL